MNNKKTSEDAVKKNNINIMFINFMSIKQCCCRYFGNKLFTIILYLILGFIAVLTSGAASEHGGKATYSTDVQLSPYNYLKQHASLPVDFLFSIYQAKDALWGKLPEAKHPFFATVKYEKKESLTRKPLRSSFVPTGLNDLLSYSAGEDYIAQKELISFASIPLYRWLLQEYSSVYYGDSDNQSMVTVTIAGMIFDLQQREQNNDATARVVLELLRRPYVQAVSAESSGNEDFFSRWLQPIQRLFLPSEERSFLVQFDMLKDLPNTDVQNRFEQLFFLKEKGYEYKKNYTFISYETDKTGKSVALSSDDIIQTDAEVEKTLHDDYLTLSDCAYKTGISASFIPKILRMQTGSSISKKLCGSFFSGIVFLSMINNGLASALPPRCEAEGTCNPQNYHSLFNSDFVETLGNNPTGHFKLGENITLDAQQNLPVFQNCNQLFSGTFETGDYVVNGGNGTSPLFACIDQASVAGNFNFCWNGQMQNQPVIANNVLSGNVVSMQQVGGCDIQRPALGNISGHNNQVAFTGRSAAMRVADNAGIIANRVSGDNNIIIAQEGQPLNAPVVSIAGGNNNTYHQENMNITRSMANYLPSNEMLVADQFTGNGTIIRQHNINATFITPDSSTLHEHATNTQNGTITTFSSGAVVQVYPPEQTLRITNSSDNSVQRSVVTNNGRLETFKNGKWESLCEDTLDQKTANVACKSMGYTQAENEAKRLLLKDSLPAITLETAPVHANKECTGYEANVRQCNVAKADTADCLQSKEAFLSCSNEIAAALPVNSRLTDPNSNSTERFDTTNTRRGRLEVNDSGELKTICSTGFDDRSANVSCNSLGYKGGHVISTEAKTLPTNIPILTAMWNCAGNESRLSNCPYRNLSNSSCTHDNDVVLACNVDTNSVYLRLTDRHSTDEYRTDTSDIGLGRMEIYDATRREDFLAFCPENINNRIAIVACRQLGFNNGTLSYLKAQAIHEGYEGNYWPSISCRGNDRDESNLQGCYLSYSYKSNCISNSQNVVILCSNSAQKRPYISLKLCPESDKTGQNNILFSGEFNSATDCDFSQCPVQSWDADGVTVSKAFELQCRHIRRHTTNKEDWLKMWDVSCRDKTDACSCRSPHEQILGLTHKNNNTNKILLVSRQSYPYNTASNPKGLIRVSKLFSGETPQLLSPANETESLKLEMLPIDQLITKQNLLGIYSSAEQGENVQLVWSSLEPDNDVYHSATFSVEGEPLLLTTDSVIIKNTDNRTIDFYPLNTMPSDDNMTRFAIEKAPDTSIPFPVRATNIFTVTIKNEWLYVASTDHIQAGKINVERYNTVTNVWDSIWGYNSYYLDYINDSTINYQMNVNYDGSDIQFLRLGEIVLDKQILVSIPDSGGCLSYLNTKTTHTLHIDPGLKGNGDKSKNNKAGLIGMSAIPIFVAVGLAGCFCYCCCNKDTSMRNNVGNNPNTNNTTNTSYDAANNGLDAKSTDGDQDSLLKLNETNL